MNEKDWEPMGSLSTEGKVSCAERLKEALSIRHMKQADLCRITGIPKSAMSQYMSGAFEPKQDRVEAIAKALNVSEAWLMGYAGVLMTRGKETGKMDYGYFVWLEEQKRLGKSKSDKETISNDAEQDNDYITTLKQIVETLTPAQCKKLLNIVRAVFYDESDDE